MAGTTTTQTRPCDSRIKSGRRYGKRCTSTASYFDPIDVTNHCGGHRTPRSLRGIGVPWYAPIEYGCDTRGHEDRPLRRVVDGVRMCMVCSGNYALDHEHHADDKDVA